MSKNFNKFPSVLEAESALATLEDCAQITQVAEMILVDCGTVFPEAKQLMPTTHQGKFLVAKLDIAPSELVDVSAINSAEIVIPKSWSVDLPRVNQAKIIIEKPIGSLAEAKNWFYGIEYYTMHPTATGYSVRHINLLKSGAKHYPAVLMPCDGTPNRTLAQVEARALIADLSSLVSVAA